MGSVLRVISYLKRYRFMFGGQLLCAVLSVSCVLVFPKVLEYIIDEVIPNKNYVKFMPMVFLTLLGFFLKDGLNACRILINNHFEQRVIFDIRSDLYKRLQNLPVKWFDGRRTGDVMTRVTEDVTAMERVLIDGVEQGIMALAQVCIVGVWIYLKNFSVGLWASLPIPLLMIGAWIYTRNARDRYKGPREASSNMNALLHDNIAGIRQIKSFTAQESEHKRFNSYSDTLRKANLRLMAWWAGYSPGMSFISMLGFVIVLWQGGLRVMEGGMTAGEFTGVLFLLNAFYEPIGRLHQINQMALSSRAAADRVFEILDSEEERNMDTGDTLPRPIRGDVRMENVSFSYEDKQTITDLSLHAPAGHTIAIVGPTGAGKSTVVNLLNRFYEITGGEISIDGVKVTELNKKALREIIGYVSQDNFLFNGSVRENLEIAKEGGATEEELWRALSVAQAESFVKALPEGLDTTVGERGVKLSGGEKQRLAIARAVLKDPPILVLDEATASVDNETEELIQTALKKLLKNRTAIVIAHRLSTIKSADKIYVLHQGQAVEEGTHEELLTKGGLYADLVRKGEQERG